MRPERVAALEELGALIRQGREIKASQSKAAMRGWQQQCAAAINHLSGGSKAHWLSRAFSQAFLVRSTGTAVVVEAGADEIIDRLIDVLQQAAAALAGADASTPTGSQPVTPRFDFVHDAKLRPVLERACLEGARAFESGAFSEALVAWCGTLEAIITDALVHAGRGPVGDWSFETRIAAAEQAGLIRRGCARLPPVARLYRERSGERGLPPPEMHVSEREARTAAQVLQVISRDLDPGR